MLRNYRILRDAAERIGVAAEGTVQALRDGRVEQEPAFTDRMLGRIEYAMDGHVHNGVSWRAKTLTDRGRRAQETRFGADFFGVLEINLPTYAVRKGFLAQAKLIEPGESMRAKDFEDLQEQCNRMLHLSADSFVFLYSRQGIYTVPALAVVGSSRTNPHNLYSRSIVRFYEEHFACFLGDQRISTAKIATLELLAAEYEARSGIQLVAEVEGFGLQPLRLAGSDTAQETEADPHHKRAAEEDERDRSSSVSLARFKHLIEDVPDEESEF